MKEDLYTSKNKLIKVFNFKFTFIKQALFGNVYEYTTKNDMASKQQKCLNYSDHFCFIYGSYTLLKLRRNIDNMIKSCIFEL